MSIKDNILYSLNKSRGLLDGLINDLKTDEDWMYQAHPKANHAMWIVGHLGLADNLFLSHIDESLDHKPEGWEEIFWYGTEVSADRSVYPATDEVLEYLRDRREKLLAVVKGLGDDFFTSPPPADGMFADAPNKAQILIFTAFHEGVHTGQLTIAHRGLGNEPLFKPEAAEATS